VVIVVCGGIAVDLGSLQAWRTNQQGHR
jgi:hypothetical protein